MRSASLWFMALVALIAFGCSQPSGGASPSVPDVPSPTTAGAALFPVTFTDDVGREVTLADPPRRIVSLSASNTEMLFALGLGDLVVAVDQYSDFPPAARDKPKVGGFSNPDLEKIVAAEPDLVVGTDIHVKGILPELDRRGLKIAILIPKDVEGVAQGIEELGRLTGRESEADTLAERLRSRVALVESRVRGAPPIRVFFELSPQLHTAGPGTFVDDVIRLAGGTNIAANTGKAWPQMSQEAVLLADPEVVFLGDHAAGESPEQVMARPGWAQTTAVKTGRVVVADPNITNRAGPRVVEGLEFVARTLHPDRMREGNDR